MNCKSASRHHYKQADDFHRCSLYINLHHESRGIVLALAFCFESNDYVFRIEKTQVALIAVYDRQSEVCFRQAIKRNGHVAASGYDSMNLVLIVFFA